MRPPRFAELDIECHGETVPPHLVALPSAPRSRAIPMVFCSHCGSAPSVSGPSRVCAHCEMGLLLRAHPHLAPAPGDAFLVCDARLRVCALSRGAEELLEVSEPSVIHQPVAELVRGVRRGASGMTVLPALLRAAAEGGVDIERTVVVLGGRVSGPSPARLGTCGPPQAALLVLDAPLP